MKAQRMTAIDGLPTLAQVITTHNLQAHKSLGQNFLLDLTLTGRIARTAGDLKGYTVLEIGPGPGGLTRALLAAGAETVHAIEADPRFMPALQEISDHYDGNLHVHEGDALKLNHLDVLADAVEAGKPIRVVANLPYNVGTVLLVNWLTAAPWPSFWSSLTLMFQREVALRITAKPGDNHYGRLAVLTDIRCHSDLCFDVSPKAFSPPPKVTSSIVHLTPRDVPLSNNLSGVETITKAAFGQRRKMLRQSLKQLGGEALLEKSNIDPKRRPETLTTREFINLADVLDSLD